MGAIFGYLFQKELSGKPFADQPTINIGTDGDDGVNRTGADLTSELLKGHET